MNSLCQTFVFHLSVINWLHPWSVIRIPNKTSSSTPPIRVSTPETHELRVNHCFLINVICNARTTPLMWIFIRASTSFQRKLLFPISVAIYVTIHTRNQIRRYIFDPGNVAGFIIYSSLQHYLRQPTPRAASVISRRRYRDPKHK